MNCAYRIWILLPKTLLLAFTGLISPGCDALVEEPGIMPSESVSRSIQMEGNVNAGVFDANSTAQVEIVVGCSVPGRELKIIQISESCSCTTAKLQTPVVSAESKSTITVDLATSRRGLNTASITVLAEDRLGREWGRRTCVISWVVAQPYELLIDPLADAGVICVGDTMQWDIQLSIPSHSTAFDIR